MLVRIWRNWNTCALLMGLWNSAASKKKIMEVLQKIKHRTTIQFSNPTSVYISKRMENRIWKRYLHTHVHGSTIHSSQEVKATQMSINKWMNKQNVVYTSNGILFSLKKEGNSVICYNIDEPKGFYARWNKPVTKRQILCDSTWYLK